MSKKLKKKQMSDESEREQQTEETESVMDRIKDTNRRMVKKSGEAMKSGAKTIVKTTKTVGEAIYEKAEDFGEDMVDAAKSAGKSLKKVVEVAPEMIDNAVDYIKENGVVDAIQQTIEGQTEFIDEHSENNHSDKVPYEQMVADANRLQANLEQPDNSDYEYGRY